MGLFGLLYGPIYIVLCFALLYEALFCPLLYIWACFAAPHCIRLYMRPCFMLCFALSCYMRLFGFGGNSFGGSDKSPHFFCFGPFNRLLSLYGSVCCIGFVIWVALALYGLFI